MVFLIPHLSRFQDVDSQRDRILTQTNPDTTETYAVFVPPHIARSIQAASQYAHSHYTEAVFPRLVE
ncbi:MAG: hypothetical protein AAFP20_20330 [Cyanobacteria bacterium J06614_10]